MMKINILTAIVFVMFALVMVLVVIYNRRLTNMKKIYFMMAFFSLLVYSGISTLYVGLCEEFFILFLIYILVFFLCFVGASYFKMGKYGINCTDNQLLNNENRFSSILDTSILSDKFLLVMTMLNFSYVLIQLVYPINRLSNLYTFSLGMEKVDFFLQRDTGRSLPIYQVFYYIELSTMAFAYIYIDRLIKKKKLGLALFIIVLKMYLKFALEQYIGRSGMIYNLLFILLIVVYDRKGRNMLKESTRLLVVLGFAFLMATPAMYAYEFIRLGLSIDSINSSNAIQTLIWQETNYGKYYQTLVELHSGDAFLNWFLWLVTLPLPSFLFSFKSNLLLVNQILSEYVTGVAYGHMYYSVKLPSLFGESLYVFGSVFFWIHAALIGIFLNKYCGMLEKHSELGVLNIYIAASCLLIGRGGSSSLFPQAVNLIVFYSMIMFILHRLKNGKRRDIRSN